MKYIYQFKKFSKIKKITIKKIGTKSNRKKKLKVGEIVIREIFDLNSIKKLNL
jgi:hypothetical protein